MTKFNFFNAALSTNVVITTDLIDYAGGQRNMQIMQVSGLPKIGPSNAVDVAFAQFRTPMRTNVKAFIDFAAAKNLTLVMHPEAQAGTPASTTLNTEV